MNFILKPYYTIGASLFLKQSERDSGTESIKLNILVNNETELTPEFYQAIGSMENEYLISLSASFIQEIILHPHLFTKLYLLIVLNPHVQGQNIIPIFFKEEDSNNHLDISGIQSYLNEQGMNDVLFPIFNYAIIGNQVVYGCSLHIIEEQPTTSPYQFVKSNVPINISIIALSEKITGLITLSQLKKYKVSEEKNNYFIEDVSQFCVVEDAKLERKLWKNRTLLYQDFLSLSKRVQEQEYYEVLDWYKKEYEILPLWYKQFGHIIKVIMGKRSFRSLFNDNVKKYKD